MRVKMGFTSRTISAKPVGVGAAFQPSILMGERSGLLTRIAELQANEDAGSVVEAKKSEKVQTKLQTGRRDQSTLAPKQRLRDEASQ
jgi:hypothetical protein